MSHKTHVATVALLLAATPVFPQAIQNLVLRNSFNPAGAGARGLGMGGAFIAVADDGTAASFNPAGLAQLRRTELAVVGFGSRLDSTIAFRRGGVADTRSDRSSHGAPEFVGLAIPFDAGGRNLTVQLAYQRSVDLFGRGTAFLSDTVSFRDLGVDQPGSVAVTTDVSPEQSGAFHTASASIGYQLTQRLGLGVALNYWLGSWDSRGRAAFSLGGGLNQQQELLRIQTDFDQKHQLSGFNVNAGLMLRYPKLSIGGVVRLPFAGGYDLEERTVSGSSGLLSPTRETVEIAADVTTQLRWPLSAGLGIALRPLSGLTLAADFTHSEWSRTVIESLPAGVLLTPQARPDPETGVIDDVFTDRNFFDLQPASLTETADTSQWRVGVEYLVQLPRLIVPLRAGLFRDRTPVVDLATGEGRRIEGWTAGLGVSFAHLAIDLAFERRTSTGAIGLRLRQGQPVSQDVPTEAVEENRFVASLIYRFGDDDPVKRFLRRLFVGPDEDAGS